MSDASEKNLLEKIDTGVVRAESAVLFLVVVVMVGLAVLQLVLRKTVDIGFEWADIVVRNMVLWLGFIGGSIATYEGRHIAIDAVSKLISPKHAAAIRVLTSLAAVVVSAIMVYAGVQFVKAEMESGSKAFGEVPAWLFEAIIPVAFTTITFHFLVGAVRDILVALGKREPPVENLEGGA
jgi:C4-dicarboxylate transporter, DctQ subunit